MGFEVVRELLLFLVIAGLLVPALQRWRVSPVLGFLVVGLAVGPHGIARFSDTLPWVHHFVLTDNEAVRELSEIGILFLLFMIGLELSIPRLVAMRRLVLYLGSLQVIVTGSVITAIAWLWDNSVAASIVLGACLALSSTAIVMQILTEQRRFGGEVGQASFAILLAQDLAVVPLLFIVTLLGHDDDSPLTALSIALGEAAIAVAVIVGVGQVVTRPLFRFVGRLRSPEAFLSVTLLVIAVTSIATHGAGLSAALGAFLAGLLVADTEYQPEIEHAVAPFKGILLGLFFVSIGMGINLAEILANPFWIAASILGLFAIKTGITAALLKLFRFRTATAVETGLLLGQGGEFAFVIIALALSQALMPVATAQFMLIVVSGTMFLTPVVALVARRVGRALEPRAAIETPATPPGLSNHVIICGYGRIGLMLAEIAEQEKTPHIALELDADIVRRHRDRGVAIYHADASRPGILEQVGIDRASAFVVTMNDHRAAERVLATVRKVAPHVPVVMRARDPEHAAALRAAGANHVVPEVFEAAMQMGQVLLQSMGYPEDAARDIVTAKRDTFRVAGKGGIAEPR